MILILFEAWVSSFWGWDKSIGGRFCLRSWSFVLVVSASRECLNHWLDSLDHVCFFITGLIFSSFHLVGFLLFAILGSFCSTILKVGWVLVLGFFRLLVCFSKYIGHKCLLRLTRAVNILHMQNIETWIVGLQLEHIIYFLLHIDVVILMFSQLYLCINWRFKTYRCHLLNG